MNSYVNYLKLEIKTDENYKPSKKDPFDFI